MGNESYFIFDSKILQCTAGYTISKFFRPFYHFSILATIYIDFFKTKCLMRGLGTTMNYFFLPSLIPLFNCASLFTHNNIFSKVITSNF